MLHHSSSEMPLRPFSTTRSISRALGTRRAHVSSAVFVSCVEFCIKTSCRSQIGNRVLDRNTRHRMRRACLAMYRNIPGMLTLCLQRFAKTFAIIAHDESRLSKLKIGLTVETRIWIGRSGLSRASNKLVRYRSNHFFAKLRFEFSVGTEWS